jgi:hypothetical protein
VLLGAEAPVGLSFSISKEDRRAGKALRIFLARAPNVIVDEGGVEGLHVPILWVSHHSAKRRVEISLARVVVVDLRSKEFKDRAAFGVGVNKAAA